jgi:hypothetical protein
VGCVHGREFARLGVQPEDVRTAQLGNHDHETFEDCKSDRINCSRASHYEYENRLGRTSWLQPAKTPNNNTVKQNPAWQGRGEHRNYALASFSSLFARTIASSSLILDFNISFSLFTSSNSALCVAMSSLGTESDADELLPNRPRWDAVDPLLVALSSLVDESMGKRPGVGGSGPGVCNVDACALLMVEAVDVRRAAAVLAAVWRAVISRVRRFT